MQPALSSREPSPLAGRATAAAGGPNQQAVDNLLSDGGAIQRAIRQEQPYALGVDVEALMALDSAYSAFQSQQATQEAAKQATQANPSLPAIRKQRSQAHSGASGSQSARSATAAYASKKTSSKAAAGSTSARSDSGAYSQQMSEEWREFGRSCADRSPRVALECLRRALALAPKQLPDYAMALTELGTVHLQAFASSANSSEVNRAVQYLRQAVEADGEAPITTRGRARLQLSAAFNQLGRHKTALQYAQEANRLLDEAIRRPDHAESALDSATHKEMLELKSIALYNMCACHEHLGRPDVALSEARRAVEAAGRLSSGGDRDGALYQQLAGVEASVRGRLQRHRQS